MKIIAVGPGNSAEWFFNQKNLNLPNDVKLLAYHRVFPFVEHRFDYWTWTDPHAAIEGLDAYIKQKQKKLLPKIIVPFWMKTISLQKKHGGTSPLHRDPKKCFFYDQTIDYLNKQGHIHFIEDAISTKDIPLDDLVFSNPKLRFNKKVYFGTVPCDGIHSESNWAQENKFTIQILPICYYLGVSEVYSIGFDNQGTGIQRTIPQFYNNQSLIELSMEKYSTWINVFSKFHKMKIFNLAPDQFTQLNKIMDYKNIENLKWTK